jgi:hypothetical protein
MFQKLFRIILIYVDIYIYINAIGLTPFGSNRVHITHKQYTGWHPVAALQYTLHTQTIHRLARGGSITVHITHKQYTGWYPLAALQYKFTHKQYTGWHPVAAVQYTLHNNSIQVGTRWQQYSTHLHSNRSRNTEKGTYITITKLNMHTQSWTLNYTLQH